MFRPVEFTCNIFNEFKSTIIIIGDINLALISSLKLIFEINIFLPQILINKKFSIKHYILIIITPIPSFK